MTDYYKICAVPKPQEKKKKRKTNGWKDKPNRYCFYCGTRYAERHEVFPGPNRQISIENGFQVNLCQTCHDEIQNRSTEQGKRRDIALRRYFQLKYEKKLVETGVTAEQARRLWLEMIGRNYLT